LISALFPSADGALTALTSSFCIDMLGLKKRTDDEQGKKKTRRMVHLTFTVIFFLCVMIFKWINNKSIIDIILKVAGYTYGPLLGLFAFGIFTKRQLKETPVARAISWLVWLALSIFSKRPVAVRPAVLIVCLAAPAICYIISENAAHWFNGFQIGIELLILNALITFGGLWLISEKGTFKKEKKEQVT
jgi:hypothetical protein